jgi:Family of unknown function (DUF5678)
MDQELELLKNFEQDSEWFHKNTSEIIKNGFVNKFVAIKGKKVISSGNNIDVLIKDLEKEGENPSYLFIEFVHPSGFTLIL